MTIYSYVLLVSFFIQLFLFILIIVLCPSLILCIILMIILITILIIILMNILRVFCILLQNTSGTSSFSKFGNHMIFIYFPNRFLEYRYFIHISAFWQRWLRVPQAAARLKTFLESSWGSTLKARLLKLSVAAPFFRVLPLVENGVIPWVNIP